MLEGSVGNCYMIVAAIPAMETELAIFKTLLVPRNAT